MFSVGWECAAFLAIFLLLVTWVASAFDFVSVYKDLWRKFRHQSLPMQVMIILALTGSILYGGSKSRGRMMSTESQTELTLEQIAAGFALAEVRSNEVHDFDVTTNATVHLPWRLRGASEDVLRLPTKDWLFPFGTNQYSFMYVMSSGLIAFDRALSHYLAPFHTNLGIVPEGNWGNLATDESLFWYNLTPSNTVQLTWQNVLYARQPNYPVSVQAELFENGDFVFRYDLSSLSSITQALPATIEVGAQNQSLGESYSLLTNDTFMTTLIWRHLGPTDTPTGDREGDGISTADEIFVYRTDPDSKDSDWDGINDFDELFVTFTDPLNPHSLSDVYCDDIALKIGDANPFDYPAGSTNTVWEHVFYSGTTNGVFSLPTSTDMDAVLKVRVSGSGSGELLVGETVVPLLSPSSQGRGLSSFSEFYVRVVRGRENLMRLRSSEDLDVQFSSDDFSIGRWPSRFVDGWAAFPIVRASEPCIHDLGAKKILVSLNPGDDFEDLTCTWNEEEKIFVENIPPRAAYLTGRFPPDTTTPITYTLFHPDYLCGETTYTQTARFCPPLPQEEFSEDESGYGIEEEYGDNDLDGSVLPETIPCLNEPTGAFTNLQEAVFLGNVLKLFPQPTVDCIHLDVSDVCNACCMCPNHHTNVVQLAAKSYNLAVHTANDERFSLTTDDRDVFVSGLAPSKDFSDSAVMFSQTGAVYRTSRYTVLGMQISHPSFDLVAVTNMCPSLGFPVLAGTNDTVTTLRLGAFVDLPTGDIRLRFRNATGRFKLYLGSQCEDYDLLIDSEISAEAVFSLEYWKYLTRNYANGRQVQTTLVALNEGSVELDFDFAAVQDGFSVTDGTTLKVTAISPPLLPDYNRDGVIDNLDENIFHSWRPLRHWINEDNDKGDVATGESDWFDRGEDADGLNDVVDGRCDLLDFAPIGLMLTNLTENIRNLGQYEFKLSQDESAINFLETQLTWEQAGDFLRNDLSLESATVTNITDVGVPLDPTCQVFLIEGVRTTWLPLVLSICKNNREILAFRLALHLSSVEDMYRHVNLRPVLLNGMIEMFGGEPFNLPDSETLEKNLFFLHGYNVSEVAARAWHAEIFKRFWQSGSNARFWAVTWMGDRGTPTGFHYNENVYNAFLTAEHLRFVVNNYGEGEKVIMAHSLGNMVVSSAIQDHGMNVSKYFMLNAALPAEALNPTLFDDLTGNVLVHDYWRDYTNQAWSCKWHELFDTEDDRNKLTWKNRFPNVASVAYNYYSTGDEVLELLNTGTPEFYDGATSSLGRYAWHKQETYKGRLGLDNNPFAWAGTSWSGWGFRLAKQEPAYGTWRYYRAAEANEIPREALATNTVFKVSPSSMNTNVISRIMLDEHLAKGIPALSPAVGAIRLGILIPAREVDLNVNVIYPHGWWRTNGELEKRWLHSDIKDAAYHYIYPIFNKIIDEGGLK